MPLVLGSPCGHELLIVEVVVLGTPSGDTYRATLDEENVARDKALLGVMVTWPAGISGTIAASYEPEFVEIHPVHGRLFPSVSTDRGPPPCLGVVSSTHPMFAPLGSVSGAVSSPGCDIWHSLLLLSVRRTCSICPCQSASISGLVYAVILFVRLWRHFAVHPRSGRVIRAGEEFGLDDSRLLMLLDSVCSVTNLDNLAAGTTSRLCQVR